MSTFIQPKIKMGRYVVRYHNLSTSYHTVQTKRKNTLNETLELLTDYVSRITDRLIRKTLVPSYDV